MGLILKRMRMRRAVKGFHTWTTYSRAVVAEETRLTAHVALRKGHASIVGKVLWNIRRGKIKRHMIR